MNTVDIKGKKLEFGKIVESKIPTIEIKCGTDVVGYLSPFRGYCFQISATSDGQGDLGSTRVIGLGNCIITEPKSGVCYRSNENLDGQSKVILSAMACLAINSYASRNECIAPDCDYRQIRIRKGSEEEAPFTKFIDSTYMWIKSYI